MKNKILCLSVGFVCFAGSLVGAQETKIEDGSSRSASAATGPKSLQTPPPPATVTGTGTTGYMPLWTGASTVGNSSIFQTGTGTSAHIGINTITPGVALSVKGATTLFGAVSLPAQAQSTTAAGKSSQPLSFTGSSFNSSNSVATSQTFRWLVEPVGNNTAAPTGTLNLLFGAGASAPAETGFKIAHDGTITFAAGQTFPGTGHGTVTSVASGTGLVGGPITGSGTLSVDSSSVPFLAAPNIFTANQSIAANLLVSGGVFGAGLTLTGSAPTFMGAGSNPNAGNAGNRVTVSGGSAAVGATDQPGGDLILAAGDGTGTGGSGALRLQTANGGASGSSADSFVDRLYIAPKAVSLGGQFGDAPLFLAAAAPGNAVGVTLRFTIRANDGAGTSVAETGACNFLANYLPDGSFHAATVVIDPNPIELGTVGASCGFAFGTSTNQIGIAMFDNLAFVPVVHEVYYQLENISSAPLLNLAARSSAVHVLRGEGQRTDALHPRIVIHGK